jgi:hypothetical protein
MQLFSKQPASTWEKLYVEKLRPYFSYLPVGGRNRYENLIQNIMDKFEHDDFESDEALAEEFLLGYHCQQKKLWDDYAEHKSLESEKNKTQGVDNGSIRKEN